MTRLSMATTMEDERNGKREGGNETGPAATNSIWFYYDSARRVGRACGGVDIRRTVRPQLVPFQDELRVLSIARRLVNRLAGEISQELVLVVVIGAEVTLLTVGREFLLLV